MWVFIFVYLGTWNSKCCYGQNTKHNQSICNGTMSSQGWETFPSFSSLECADEFSSSCWPLQLSPLGQDNDENIKAGLKGESRRGFPSVWGSETKCYHGFCLFLRSCMTSWSIFLSSLLPFSVSFIFKFNPLQTKAGWRWTYSQSLTLSRLTIW